MDELKKHKTPEYLTKLKKTKQKNHVEIKEGNNIELNGSNFKIHTEK